MDKKDESSLTSKKFLNSKKIEIKILLLNLMILQEKLILKLNK